MLNHPDVLFCLQPPCYCVDFPKYIAKHRWIDLGLRLEWLPAFSEAAVDDEVFDVNAEGCEGFEPDGGIVRS